MPVSQTRRDSSMRVSAEGVTCVSWTGCRANSYIRCADEFDGAHDAVDCQVAGAERHAQAAVSFQRRAEDTCGSGSSRDRIVTVHVDHSGHLDRIEFAAQVSTLSKSQLTSSVMEAYRAALSDVRTQMVAVASEIFGADSPTVRKLADQ